MVSGPTTTVKKTVNGYNYKYADLAAIHEQLEAQGITYYQYTEYCVEAGADYIYTVVRYGDDKESKPLRGCRVLYGDGKMKSLAQEQGSGLTYARRYSLLMALGWASEDDDGATAGRPAQITGTASSYARKYALNGLFLIDDTKDADTDEYRKNTTQRVQNIEVKASNKISFQEVRERLSEIVSVDDLNRYWTELHLTDKQANILKKDFADRKAKLGAGE